MRSLNPVEHHVLDFLLYVQDIGNVMKSDSGAVVLHIMNLPRCVQDDDGSAFEDTVEYSSFHTEVRYFAQLGRVGLLDENSGEDDNLPVRDDELCVPPLENGPE